MFIWGWERQNEDFNWAAAGIEVSIHTNDDIAQQLLHMPASHRDVD